MFVCQTITFESLDTGSSYLHILKFGDPQTVNSTNRMYGA